MVNNLSLSLKRCFTKTLLVGLIFSGALSGSAVVAEQIEDFRITHIGPDGDLNYGGGEPSVAYNSHDDEVFIVFGAVTPDLAAGEAEIFGQRANARTGARIGSEIRISFAGPEGDPGYIVFGPAVAYNPNNNEYLVAWVEEDDSLADPDEREIFGQRINAQTGALLGSNFRISSMGPDGDTAYYAQNPRVAYNSTNNEYLVVWDGVDNIGIAAD